MDLEKSVRTSSPVDVDGLGLLIARTQRKTGEIPWHEGGKTDPWDMVEAAMGLTVAGYFREARRAFEWLARTQIEDGSWYAAYRDGNPEDRGHFLIIILPVVADNHRLEDLIILIRLKFLSSFSAVDLGVAEPEPDGRFTKSR